MKKSQRRMVLSKETLLDLNRREMSHPWGGATRPGGTVGCPNISITACLLTCPGVCTTNAD